MVTDIQMDIHMEGGKENMNLVVGEQKWQGGG